jgi:hypothetical protein
MNGDWSDYESGPFCKHWQYAYNCDELCAKCGHRCSLHGDDECFADGGCGCKSFADWSHPAPPSK